jgi:hypothetical protein
MPIASPAIVGFNSPNGVRSCLRQKPFALSLLKGERLRGTPVPPFNTLGRSGSQSVLCSGATQPWLKSNVLVHAEAGVSGGARDR